MSDAWHRILDRLSLLTMAAGMAWMLLPDVEGAMRGGFFVTLAATIAQIVVGHLPRVEVGAAAADAPPTDLTPKSEE